MAKTFETFIAEERERINKEREGLLAKRAEIDQQIAASDRELAAITAYEQVKQGKAIQGHLPLQARTRRASGVRAPRGAREEIKRKIIDLVREHPEGLVSSQIAEALPDYAKQIPNVLSILKKDGALHQEARRGPYYIPATA